MDPDEDNLDSLLNTWKVPPLGRDLTDAILARARSEDDRLDRLLAGSADAIPALSRDLCVPVMRTIRRRGLTRRLVAAAGGLAAAAAAMLVWVSVNKPVLNQQSGPADNPTVAANVFTPGEQDTIKALADDLPVLIHMDTIKAMQELEDEAADIQDYEGT